MRPAVSLEDRKELISKIESLAEVIEVIPKDWDVYLILADLYEEIGKERRGRFYRWIGRNHKRPWGGRVEGTDYFHWWKEKRKQKQGLDEESDLPNEIWKKMKAKQEHPSGWKEWMRIEQAWCALYRAWRRVVDEKA